jgi:hypothetical protein
MGKRDHTTKATPPRVLTDAEIDSLSVSKMSKLVREGLAALPSQRPSELEKLIEEELASVRLRKTRRRARRLNNHEIN